MTEEMTTHTSPPATQQKQGSTPKTQNHRKEVTQEQQKEIVRLHKMQLSVRKISKRIDLGRKVVRRILTQLGLTENRPPSTHLSKLPSKLDPFKKQIKEKAQQGLTVTRILREIRELGYTGGRTILADFLQTTAIKPTPSKKVWRRFETAMGEETQFDWSPYRVYLSDTEHLVYAFGAVLCFCRKMHVRFYLDDREPTLLEAHTHAFADFKGVTQRGVYDRMATVTLGTIGKDRTPLWHPDFLALARYYGFEPYLCKPADPDRKGKDERIFWYLERDFLRGRRFDSLQDLNAKVRLWLDNVANCRIHGTTRRIPDEAWLQERPFLIALPDAPYPAGQRVVRKIGPDSVISVSGTSYTVPATLAHKTVSVLLWSDHFDVLDQTGKVAFSRSYVSPDKKGTLILNSAHYDAVKPRHSIPQGPAHALEQAFLTRFPDLLQLIDGLKLRMKGLAHIHLRTLWRLADRYGDHIFLPVALRVQASRRFDAQAVRRILLRDFPLPDEPLTATPLTSAASILLSLGDVDSGSLDDYAHLDSNSQTTLADKKRS